MIIDDNTSEPDFKLALPVTDESALKKIWTFHKKKINHKKSLTPKMQQKKFQQASPLHKAFITSKEYSFFKISILDLTLTVKLSVRCTPFAFIMHHYSLCFLIAINNKVQTIREYLSLILCDKIVMVEEYDMTDYLIKSSHCIHLYQHPLYQYSLPC